MQHCSMNPSNNSVLCLWGYIDIASSASQGAYTLDARSQNTTVYVSAEIFEESQIHQCIFTDAYKKRSLALDCFLSKQLKAQVNKDAPLFKLIILTCAINLLVQSSVPLCKGK